MTLAKVSDLLREAQSEGYAVGAFNVANMEMVMGTIQAAEHLDAPIILQIAESRLDKSPIALIGPMMVSAAKKARVPVAVHLDHGKTLGTIVKVLRMGFNSVMYDGSRYPVVENASRTRTVKELADAFGADVEAEVGGIGGYGKDENQKDFLASSESVSNFLNRVTVTSLAVGIGNYHGVFRGEPDLQFNLLKQISDVATVPLVLHGGSGISKEDFQKAIRFGISKINIATSTFLSVRDKLSAHKDELSENDYFYLQNLEVEATKENVEKHLGYFLTAGEEKQII